ncbi:MAG: antibiotic biosynthesis monooxygenase [Deltaproteobacteria bacterium]|jgi:quinol monooxygenase YgiN|nr:antibiotic biosynthesis monooxygenase [Deltaproteobacteria bacterium]
MIIVKIILNVLPEKQLEFKQTLLSIVELTRQETGCIKYTVMCDIEDNNQFNLLEEWETREDIDNHIKSTRFGVLLGSKTLLRKPMDIQILTVSISEGIEAVTGLRGKKDFKENWKTKQKMNNPKGSSH